MSVSTALAGAMLAPDGLSHPIVLLLVAAGTLFVGSGAVALNQYLERDFDALMQRTRNRPLPSGAILPLHGLIFGSLLAGLGVALLAFTTILAAGLAVLTLGSYVLVYTPMKRTSHFATAVGGLPGAIPPVIGWTAITGTFAPQAYVLFIVVFLWQMPHFLALGWMYRNDYAAGGYKLLPSLDKTGNVTARIIMVYTWALLPASVLPFVLGMAGPVFLALVCIAWLAFMIPAYRLTRQISDGNARKVFLASLIYIPAFFASIGIDRLLGL
jgi:protoheme IX farnesyltransferase